MNASKLSDWLQMTAAVGVVAGLILVAYEIRVSNRIGLDQAHAESANRWSAADAVYSTAEAADLFIRANEGDVLSRQEMLRLDGMLSAWLSAVYYDWTLYESGTFAFDGGFADSSYAASIQWVLGSEVGRRKWTTDSGDWNAKFAASVDSALASSKQRNVLSELDYFRGATESVE
ncbi:MAG: hypothetical protein ACI88G_000336 [Woeseiaceae bacterium]|jgi:hypothetical protein